MRAIFIFSSFVLGVSLVTILTAAVLGAVTVLAYRLVVLFLSLIFTSNLGGKLLVEYYKERK